jgi:hypothetical protein
MSNQNQYIVSGFGFLKEIRLTEEFKQVPEWTNNLIEAKKFTSKQAKNQIRTMLPNMDVICFVWNPYQEYPKIRKWEVVQRGEFYDVMDETEHKVLEWFVRKSHVRPMTDAKHLITKGEETGQKLYMTEEEAKDVARKKNMEMLEELNRKVIGVGVGFNPEKSNEGNE